MGKWVGRSLKRREDARLLTGRGRFVDDLDLGKVLHAAIVRSPYAHARIGSVNADSALRSEGVISILLPEDVKRMSRPFPSAVDARMDHFATAVEEARYVGEPVAVVVAADRYLAEDAAELVEVDYDPLPVVVDAEEAAAEGAPLVHEGNSSNVANHRRFSWGDPDGAFAAADLVVRGRFRFPRYTSLPLEGYVVVAEFDPLEEAYTVWSNFQGPFTMHPVASTALGVPLNKLRFIVPADIGGGFGIKSSVFASIVLVALAARKAGGRVKWVEDRYEHLLSSSSHADRIEYLEGAFRRDGILLGLRKRLYDNVGAYVRAPEPACTFRTIGNTTGPYRVRNVEMETFVVVTNKAPTGPNRGYGCQQLYFSLERLMNLAAERLAMEPAEIRRVNFIGKDAFPYATPMGGIYDSGDFHLALDRALEMADFDALKRRREVVRASGGLFGIGLATVVDPSVTNIAYLTVAQTPEERAQPDYLSKSGSGESCTVSVDALGNITAVMNTVPEGQSHETTLSQVIADELGAEPDQVRVATDMDTLTRPWTVTAGSYSSRFAAVGAGAAAVAARRVREKMTAIAAHHLEADPEDVALGEGRFFVRSEPARSVSFRRVAGMAHWNQSNLPPGMEPGISVSHMHNFPEAGPPDEADRVSSSCTYGFVADLVAVEIDRETGFVEILKYVTVHDCGNIINPKVVEGQVYGGTLHGVGGALYEELAYAEDGQLLTASLMDYLCPTAMEAPRLEIGHTITPSPISELGTKGCGESGSMSAPAAVANAVADALSVLGGAGTVTELPLSPEKVWRMIASAGAGEATA